MDEYNLQQEVDDAFVRIKELGILMLEYYHHIQQATGFQGWPSDHIPPYFDIISVPANSQNRSSQEKAELDATESDSDDDQHFYFGARLIGEETPVIDVEKDEFQPEVLMNAEIHRYKLIIHQMSNVSKLNRSQWKYLRNKPLLFWKPISESNKLWIMSRIAINKFNIPLSNNQAERSFNHVKDIITSKRSRMKSDTLSKMQLLAEKLRNKKQDESNTISVDERAKLLQLCMKIETILGNVTGILFIL